MRRSGLDARTLLAIAIGGIIGATVRRGAGTWFGTESPGGWFAYAPNTSVTVGTNIEGFTPVGSVQTIASAGGLPIDTLIVNLAGCLLLGALTMLLVSATNLPRRGLVGAATGVCGSLTTFSTFAVEVASLLRARPALPQELATVNVRFERDMSNLVLYLVLSIAGGALAFWLGRILADRIVPTAEVPTVGGEA